jgi:hypothetical protein
MIGRVSRSHKRIFAFFSLLLIGFLSAVTIGFREAVNFDSCRGAYGLESHLAAARAADLINVDAYQALYLPAASVAYEFMNGHYSHSFP